MVFCIASTHILEPLFSTGTVEGGEWSMSSYQNAEAGPKKVHRRSVSLGAAWLAAGPTSKLSDVLMM